MSTRPKDVRFGEWLPDLPELNNPGALEVKNCIPQINSYRSLNSVTAFTNGLADVALGAFWLQNSTNTIFNFAGDKNGLYRLDSNNTIWTDVSKAAYSDADNWDFAKFGDRVIATDVNNPVQYYEAGVSSAFEDLGGSPPQAARIAVVRDFVVLGDTVGASLGNDSGPNFIQWSAFNNSDSWTPSKATQADRQELFGRGGRVQRIVPGEYGVIIQEHSIRRMDYVGPPVIFQIDEVERGRGTPAPNSVIWTGDLVFYYGHDGFYRFNGISSEPIGANRINDWVADNADVSSIDKMRGAIDRRNRLAIWTFRTSGNLDYNDRILIFNWAANRWSYGELNTQIIAEYVTSGQTLDDPVFNDAYSEDIDGAEQLTFDSTTYLGGALSLQAFNTDNQSGTFSGDPLVATIDTVEQGGATNGTTHVNSVRPLVTGANETGISVAIGKRKKQTETASFTPARLLNDIGEANARVTARYLRYRVNISGGFDHATGVKAMVRVNAGRR